MTAPCLACVVVLSGFLGDPAPAATPRPYWKWVNIAVLARGSWTVDVLHGGRIIVIAGDHRITAELSAKQRRKLETLTAALPTEKRSYRLGRYVLDGPELELCVDDGTRKTTYDVVGVGRTPAEVRELRAIVDVAIFLRGLVPPGDVFDPGRWLLPDS